MKRIKMYAPRSEEFNFIQKLRRILQYLVFICSVRQTVLVRAQRFLRHLRGQTCHAYFLPWNCRGWLAILAPARERPPRGHPSVLLLFTLTQSGCEEKLAPGHRMRKVLMVLAAMAYCRATLFIAYPPSGLDKQRPIFTKFSSNKTLRNIFVDS